MKGRVEVLCSAALAPGFGLTGLRPTEAQPGVESSQRLRALASQADVAVILVEDFLYNSVTEETHKLLAQRLLPLIVPFPGVATGASRAAFESRIAELLRQAIGYRVRLR